MSIDQESLRTVKGLEERINQLYQIVGHLIYKSTSGIRLGLVHQFRDDPDMPISSESKNADAFALEFRDELLEYDLDLEDLLTARISKLERNIREFIPDWKSHLEPWLERQLKINI